MPIMVFVSTSRGVLFWDASAMLEAVGADTEVEDVIDALAKNDTRYLEVALY